MTGGSGAKDAAHPFTDEARALGIDVDDPRALAWMETHLPEFRQQASGQRPMYWILGIGFVVGLATHVGGFLLKRWASRPEPARRQGTTERRGRGSAGHRCILGSCVGSAYMRGQRCSMASGRSSSCQGSLR